MRKDGKLTVLQPGESVSYAVNITMLQEATLERDLPTVCL
jgi:hypothetical protein